MRMLRDSYVGGFAPKPPGFCRVFRQNSWVASQLGAAPPNPDRTIADGRRTRRLPTIPAAESALGLRPRSALSSAQVLPEWTTSTSPCNDSSADGVNPLTRCLTPGVHFNRDRTTKWFDASAHRGVYGCVTRDGHQRVEPA